MNTVATTLASGALIRVKVIGVGGAGGNALDTMARHEFGTVQFLAVNTDAQALEKISVPRKLVLGSKLTRGLGAGGDPEVGRAAAEMDNAQIREFCTDTEIVFVVAGLGGGTGTGASPLIARIAQETGALVISLVTLPFDFEGGRRLRQAQLGLQRLKEASDAVICLPNQKILKILDENTPMLEAFRIVNEHLLQGIRGIWRMISHVGLINVDFADLCSVTKGRHSESCFATAEASGETRAQQVVEKLMMHPLLEAGQILAESDAVLISVVAGSDLTMSEINRVMDQINRHCENAHLIMGAGIDPTFENRLSVTLIASRKQSFADDSRGRQNHSAERHHGNGVSHQMRSAGEMDTQFLSSSMTSRPPSRYVPPPPSMSEEKIEQMAKNNGSRTRRNASKLRQGTLQLEIISKGRFEKSEPTIHQGEDLDVPTYIRRGVALN